MKRSITFAVAAAGLTFALAGCGTGIDAQTAEQVAAVPGYTKVVPVADGGTVSIQNATLAYPGVAGYKSGEEAKLQLTLINTTSQPVTVNLTSTAGVITVKGGPITLEPGTAKMPEATIKLNRDVLNGQSVRLMVNFGVASIDDAQVPVDTPMSPAPRVKQEIQEGGGGEGH